VDTILSKGIEDDAEDSGRLRLTKALSALAQDPRFKVVLDGAQREVDQYFTLGGQRRRGQGTPFNEAATTVKRLAEQVDSLRRQAEESTVIEAAVGRLRDERSVAEARWVEATSTRESVQARVARSRQRAEAEGRLAEARRTLAGIDAQRARVAEHERAVEDLAQRVVEADAAVGAAASHLEAEEAGQRKAEEAERTAQSKDRERARQLQRARGEG
jgi:chromosome segregation ATPase